MCPLYCGIWHVMNTRLKPLFRSKPFPASHILQSLGAVHSKAIFHYSSIHVAIPHTRGFVFSSSATLIIPIVCARRQVPRQSSNWTVRVSNMALNESHRAVWAPLSHCRCRLLVPLFSHFSQLPFLSPPSLSLATSLCLAPSDFLCISLAPKAD